MDSIRSPHKVIVGGNWLQASWEGNIIKNKENLIRWKKLSVTKKTYKTRKPKIVILKPTFILMDERQLLMTE